MIPPHKAVVIECQIQDTPKNMEKTTGIVVPSQELEEKSELAITSSISEFDKNHTVYITAFNMVEHYLTLPFKTETGKFSILTLSEFKKFIPILPETLALAEMKQPDDVELGINELIEEKTSMPSASQLKPPPEYEKLWFPTLKLAQTLDHFPPFTGKFLTKSCIFKALIKLNRK